MRISLAWILAISGLGFFHCGPNVAAAQNAAARAAFPPPATFTAEQEHQNMMDQLGIEALRPGPSGDENTPNHANYDKANPYPNLPDPLTMNNGEKVTTDGAGSHGGRTTAATQTRRI